MREAQGYFTGIKEALFCSDECDLMEKSKAELLALADIHFMCMCLQWS